MITGTVETPKMMCIVTVFHLYIIRQVLSVSFISRPMYLDKIGLLAGIGCIIQVHTFNLSVLHIQKTCKKQKKDRIRP